MDPGDPGSQDCACFRIWSPGELLQGPNRWSEICSNGACLPGPRGGVRGAGRWAPGRGWGGGEGGGNTTYTSGMAAVGRHLGQKEPWMRESYSSCPHPDLAGPWGCVSRPAWERRSDSRKEKSDVSPSSGSGWGKYLSVYSFLSIHLLTHSQGRETLQRQRNKMRIKSGSAGQVCRTRICRLQLTGQDWTVRLKDGKAKKTMRQNLM